MHNDLNKMVKHEVVNFNILREKSGKNSSIYSIIFNSSGIYHISYKLM